jgi:hypothetical protein
MRKVFILLIIPMFFASMACNKSSEEPAAPMAASPAAPAESSPAAAAPEASPAESPAASPAGS